MGEKAIKGSKVEYTDELKRDLDRRHTDYKSGKAKIITAAESKIRIRKLLKTGRRK